MKFVIDSGALVGALNAVRGAVSPKSTIPILSSVLLDVSEKGVTISATNLDIESRTMVQADVSRNGTLCLPAVMLLDIAKRFTRGALVHVESIDNGARVVIKSGRAKFHLSALNASDWPEMTAPAGAKTFSMPGDDFALALGKVKFAISTEETRYYLNGIYLHHNGAGLAFVSTDGHRLAKVVSGAPDGSDGIAGIIIPSLAALEFEKLAGGSDKIEISVCSTRVTASDGVTTIRSKTIDGTFPDYVRVIPQDSPHVATVNGADWSAGAARVATVASDRGRAVKCSFRSDALDLSVAGGDGGDAFDSVDADYTGPDLSIGFNAAYLASALATFPGDAVTIKLSDAGSPAVMTDNGPLDLTVVLMPMRVS